MGLDRGERIKELFLAALAQERDRRSSFLAKACAGQDSLRREIEGLLEEYERAGALEQTTLAVDVPTRDATRPAFSPHDVISGRFEVIRLIGKGGMGEVYEAQDLELRVRVALKAIRPEISSDPVTISRFRHEIQLARKVTHPNVCRIFDVEHDRLSSGLEITFLTMELLEGETLAAHLRRRVSLPTEEALLLVEQMVEALRAAHDARVIHRDFKPSNVILVPADAKIRAVVTDFGLARAIEPMGRETISGLLTTPEQLVGTPPYMAPEQLEGGEATPATDLYALGLVMYEMVTGKLPFSSRSGLGQILWRLKGLPPSPKLYSPNLDPRWESVIMRCLQTTPAFRFQDAREVMRALRGAPEIGVDPSARVSGDSVGAAEASPVLTMRHRRFARTLRWALLGAAALLIAVLIPFLWRRREPSKTLELEPLTADGGMTWDPTLSADGKTLAYSSDRDGPGNLNIWVQNVASGSVVQVTHGKVDNVTPALSPDGSLVAYRSEGNGGGIYIAPVYGGYERLVARFGRNPRFSPDGAQIAYWSGESHNIYDRFVPGGRIYVVSSQGGAPRQIQPSFLDARYPTWGADGEHIMFQGSRASSATFQEASDWWVSSLDGRDAVRTGAFEILRRERIELYGCPFFWSRGTVLFSGWKVYGTSLWQLPISTGRWKARGPVRLLTSGTLDEVSPWLSPSGRLVLASQNASVNIWSFAPSKDGATGEGSLKRITFASGVDLRPSISSNARRLVFSRRLGEVWKVWFKDIEKGQEISLPIPGKSTALISADGSKVAYSIAREGKHPIYVMPIAGGSPEQVCDDCGELSDWSHDGQRFLYSLGVPATVGLLNLSSGRRTQLIARSNTILDQARFSPDGNWVAFVSRTDDEHSQIQVVQLEKGGTGVQRQWISLTDGLFRDLRPTWSARGDSLLLYSNRDGFYCVWQLKLDPATKQPRSELTPFRHFHYARLSPMDLSRPAISLALGGDTVVLNLAEITSNIFTAELPEP
jgi:eukaryotic-like serine/threonine-protein kinase